MRRRGFLATAAALAAGPVFGQGAASGPASGAAAGVVTVQLVTGLGPIVLELRGDRAPITTANFLSYVDQKRLDGAAFYRAAHYEGQPSEGLVQGGLSGSHPERALPPIANEGTTQTGLRHTDGVISMARYAPGSATAEFFICVGANTQLDANPAASGDNLGFAAFGRVVQGMDVVGRIWTAPTSPTAGEGVFRGQMLDPPIPIVRAARL
ncbi:MAG TPA: peptidylprolyl isomerase [Caulobacteraceae bacterium]|nr:peptidylprolyl isomerase [Caulobacteraceae bacterium]